MKKISNQDPQEFRRKHAGVPLDKRPGRRELLALTPSFVVILVLFVGYRSVPSRIIVAIGMALSLVIVGVLTVTVFRIRDWWRLSRLVKDSDYRVCTGCRYRLSGLADTGVCPECGLTYTLEELTATWKGAGLGDPKSS